MYPEKLTRNDLIDHGVVDVQNEDVYVYGKKGKVRKLPFAHCIVKRKYVPNKIYPTVQFISRKTGKNVNFAVARIIYAWNFGEVPEGLTVYHIDGNPFNNDMSNLELVSVHELAARRYM